MKLRISLALAVLAATLIATAPAQADVHTVKVGEYYTQCDNASTDVQYIELLATTVGNFFRQCASIEIKRTVGGTNTFFAKPAFAGQSDSGVFALNETFLIATPGFQAVTGVTPDLVIPNGTLDPAGGVIRFAADSGCAVNWGTIHEVRYGDQGVDPAPGPHQAAVYRVVRFDFILGARTPKNLAGASESEWTCQPVPVESETWSGIKQFVPES